MNYTSNPQLRGINPDWKGTPIDEDQRFVNTEFPFEAKLTDVLKWKCGPQPQKEEKKNDPFQLQVMNDLSFLKHHSDCIVWLGHATFFIRLHGVSVLIDPVFYDVPLVKRYIPHALSPDVFTQLDYLLISHDHQDHCQKKSIKAVVHYNPEVKVLTGLNMEKLLRPWLNGNEVQCAGWYQQYNTSAALRIYFLPSRHWSKRSITDTNKRLWGAFVFQTDSKTIYFSGDTGYGSHFKEAHKLFPAIDVAIIGVGAFKPEWFMSPNHISPTDAVTAFDDLGAKHFIPMHYGTFDLSDEPCGEPLRVLRQQQSDGKIKGELNALQPGEIYTSF